MTSELNLLAPEEVVIWSGRPNSFHLAIRRAWYPVFFGALLLAAVAPVLHGIWPLPSHQNPEVVAIFYSFAGIVGVAGISRGIFAWLRASRTKYFLTNRRVVIDTAAPFARRISIPLRHLRYIDFRSKFRRSSDLVFMQNSPWSLAGWGMIEIGFLAIPDAVEVEKLLREAVEQTLATRQGGPWQ
jgi:hypothetical protein